MSIVSCAGCELLFPLPQPSTPVDAAGDAADAPLPVTCPADHSAPAFSNTLTKLLPDTCAQYSEAGGRAVCMDFQTGPREGPIGMLSDVVLEPPPVGAVFSAVISPDGEQLITVVSDEVSPSTIQVYLREGATWMFRSTSSSVGGAVMGVPSRGPNARMLVHDPNAQALVELEQDADFEWTTLRTSSPSTLGLLRPNNSMMNLSPDGRQVIYKRPDGIAYAFRASLEDDFADATMIDAPAYLGASWVFMTANCEQLFGSFLTGGVFVAAQI